MLGAESEARLLAMDLDEFLEALEDGRAIDARRRYDQFAESLAAARGSERQVYDITRRLLRTARVEVDDSQMGDVSDLMRDMGG